jgi:hypothetical protein
LTGLLARSLAELRLVDRDAVRFFVGYKADGMKFEGCPAYVRKWMAMEKHRSAACFDP